jgi:hypothetical protein
MKDSGPSYASEMSERPRTQLTRYWMNKGCCTFDATVDAAHCKGRAASSLKPFGGYASAGMSSCLMRPLGWMSTCRSGPVPELTNLCGTPAGTTTI